MIFWIDNDFKISYDDFITDLNSSSSVSSSTSYNYFFSLLKSLIGGNKFNNYNELISFLKTNSSLLNFEQTTSGTTSKPKIVNVSLNICLRQIKESKIKGNRWGMCYPAESFASKQVFFQAFFNKEPIINCFYDDFKLVYNLIITEKINRLACTPTFLNMLIINSTNKIKKMKTVTVGGEILSNALINDFNNVFVNAKLINIYASSEAGSLLYSNDNLFKIPKKYKDSVKIKNNEIIIHKKLINKINLDLLKGNWFFTGDKIKFIKKNYFQFIGRQSTFLNIGGNRVNPINVEDEIHKIDGVQDVRVYGKPNSILGTILCAEVVSDSISTKEIKKILSLKLDKYKVPQIIRKVDNVMLTKSGKKIRKK